MAKGGIGPIFRCNGIEAVFANEKGSLTFVKIVEVSGTKISIAYPPEAAEELANSVLTAGRLADNRKHATRIVPGENKAPPGQLVTDHKVHISDDANSLVLELRTGKARLLFEVSKSRSPKIRADLEKAEKDMGEKKKRITN